MKTIYDLGIRTAQIDGAVWFVGGDVCRALGLKSYASTGYTQHFRKLDRDQIRPMRNVGIKLTGTGMHNAKLISESGFYRLIMRAHPSRPEVHAFQDWVCRVVLPAIRKDGGYILGEEKVVSGEMSEDEIIVLAIKALERKVGCPGGEMKANTPIRTVALDQCEWTSRG